MFHVLVADPPWSFNDHLPGETRGASKNYACLSVDELKAFPLPALADDCVLFMWRVASMQREALDVAEAWGFTVKAEVVWLKKTVNGNRFFGMGRITRAEHEVCLVGTRGKVRVLSRSVRSTFTTDLNAAHFDGLSAPVGRHSEKPDAFFDVVEALYGGPFCELFARRQRPGWTCLGDQA